MADVQCAGKLLPKSPSARFPGRIPSLDGLRALSIMLVIISHVGLHYLHVLPGGIRLLAWIGGLGVSTFFVISGFLITFLLLKEEDEHGAYSLQRFYVRRIFRILPPFYLMALVMLLASYAGLVELSRGAWLAAISFTWNYSPYASGWTLAHTWSLSVEEQFYLLWPLALQLLGRKRAGRLALTLIVFGPVLRVVTYALLPGWRGHIGMMMHTRVDNLMFGCVLALFYDHPRMTELRQWVLRRQPLWGALVLLGIVSPLLSVRFEGAYDLPFGFTIDGVCISMFLLWTVREPETIVGRVLNQKWLVHVGVLSYSLYLWQQPLMNPANHFWGGEATAVAFAFLAAESSYVLVERPALRLRTRIETMITRRPELRPLGISVSVGGTDS